jgi:hypothetical protein
MFKRSSLTAAAILISASVITAQDNLKLKYNNSTIYTGIEVGSKGVKMSIVEIGKNAKSNGAFHVLKDSSINTDFISFTEPTFNATLASLAGLYTTVTKDYKIPSRRVFTVVSSGVKGQAEKENKTEWIKKLENEFQSKVKDQNRKLEVINVVQEAWLSHLGIVPEERRYTTFLIDIGSGNSKGGHFPFANSKDFKLFQLTWGTKSVSNETDKRAGEDKTIPNFKKQLTRVLSGIENSEIVYAVNSSGAYPLSDNIAVSGGIAWAVSTLMFPSMTDQPVIPVNFKEVTEFYEKMNNNFTSLSDASLTKELQGDKESAGKEIRRVHSVFDQKALLAGTGLLLKIMRQFESAFESKQFYLVKNGQVGWISAYVDQTVNSK